MHRAASWSLALILVLLRPQGVDTAPRAKPQFTLIADLGAFAAENSPYTRINKFGVVAFVAPTQSGTAIFKGDGTFLTKVIETGADFVVLDQPVINDRGVVAFTGTTAAGQHGVFKATPNGGVQTVAIVDCCAGNLAMNNLGEVVFVAGPSQQGQARTMYLGDGHTLNILASAADGFSALDRPDINDRGVVAFRSRRNGRGEIITSDGKSLTTIADTSDFLCSLAPPHINDAGTVAFDVFLAEGCGNSPSTAVMVYERGELTMWARGGVEYQDIGAALDINDRGHVAVLAAGLDGRGGTFIQSEDEIELVVAKGDIIDGRVLQSFPGAPSSFNNKDQFAFVGRFDDGKYRLYRVSP